MTSHGRAISVTPGNSAQANPDAFPEAWSRLSCWGGVGDGENGRK